MSMLESERLVEPIPSIKLEASPVPQMPLRILASSAAKNVLHSAVAVAARESSRQIEIISLDAVSTAVDLAGVEVAYFSRDMYERPPGAAESPVRKLFSLLREAPDLKWLHICSSGADRPIYAELAARGVLTTTSAGANSSSVALTALTGLLALNRQFPRHFQSQVQRTWRTGGLNEFSESLHGQQVVVIGTGYVGTEVACLVKALGMRAIGLNRSGHHAESFDEVLPIAQLSEVLGQTSWLIICCPLNAGTRHLVGAEVLCALPPHAYIINVGRGGVIDQPALVRALEAKQIAGAHLDVFEVEPLPEDSPLWRMDNVIVTPHAAAHGREVIAATNEQFLDNLRSWLAGDPMRNVYRPD